MKLEDVMHPDGIRTAWSPRYEDTSLAPELPRSWFVRIVLEDADGELWKRIHHSSPDIWFIGLQDAGRIKPMNAIEPRRLSFIEATRPRSDYVIIVYLDDPA